MAAMKQSKKVDIKNKLNKYHEEFEETPTWTAVITVLGYAILSVLGWLRDFLRNIGIEKKETSRDLNPKVLQFFYFLNYSFFFLFYKGFCSTL
jgi:hypothetical protein